MENIKDEDNTDTNSHNPNGGEAKNFVCDICAFSITCEIYLKKHRTKEHGTGEVEIQEFQCPYCSKMFSQRINMEGHITKMHADSIDTKLKSGQT